MEPESKSAGMQRASQDQLRSRVPPANAGHHPGTDVGFNYVGHHGPVSSRLNLAIIT